MNITPDLTAMYAVIEADPSELSAYGGIADMLEELGYASLPHAYRWCMRRGRFPHMRMRYAARGVPGRQVPQKFRWAWYIEPVRWGSDYLIRGTWPMSKRVHHGLPALLIRGEQKVYPSHSAAMMDLAKWLQGLRECWELEEPKRKEL